MTQPTPAELAPADPAPDEPASDDATRWRGQFRVALALLIGFGALVVAMIWIAGGDDIVWQRRVYVFGTVEAIVFTAVGWIFGREVSRSAASSARADADAARDEAAEARALAADQASRADRANTTLHAIHAAARTANPDTGGGISDVGTRQDRRPVDLRSFIEELLRTHPS